MATAYMTIAAVSPSVTDRELNEENSDESLLSSAKRLHGTRQQDGAKRNKVDQNAAAEKITTQKVIDISAASQPASNSYSNPRLDGPHELDSTLRELMVPDIWPSEFFMLHHSMFTHPYLPLSLINLSDLCS